MHVLDSKVPIGLSLGLIGIRVHCVPHFYNGNVVALGMIAMAFPSVSCI